MGFESDSDQVEVLCIETATVFLAGEIDDVLSSRVVQAIGRLRAMGKESLTLLISSPGGSVYAGYAIADAVKAARVAGVEVHGVVTGEAASAAIFPLLECSTRQANAMSVLMVHGMTDTVRGDHQDIEAVQRLNSKMIEQQARLLANHTAQDAEYWQKILKSRLPQYYLADEAVAEGLVHDIIQ